MFNPLEPPKIEKRLVIESGYCAFCHDTGVNIYEYEIPVSIDDNNQPIVDRERCCESCGDNLEKEFYNPTSYEGDDDLF